MRMLGISAPELQVTTTNPPSRQHIPARMGTEVTNTNSQVRIWLCSGFSGAALSQPPPSAAHEQTQRRHPVARSLQGQTRPGAARRGPATTAEPDERRRGASAEARSPRRSQNPNTTFPNPPRLPKRRKRQQKPTAKCFGFTAPAALNQEASSSPPQTPSTGSCLCEGPLVWSRPGGPARPALPPTAPAVTVTPDLHFFPSPSSG